MDAIAIQGLSKTFSGKGGTKVKALDNLELTVKEGEVFGFLGPNGAGKSTTIKILLDLIRPTTGRAAILGRDVGLSESRERVGYLPENPSFYDYLSAAEYLELVGKLYHLPKARIREQSRQVLERLNLLEASKRPIRGYSKGMVQRLGLAQVLVHDPAVLILDEPMSGLDPVGRALVKEIILELKAAGKSVFFSTHITSDVEAVCDRVGVILGGRLRSVEEVRTILTTGIVGYKILLLADGHEEEHQIGKDELPAFIAEAVRQGREVSLIEPRRKNIEQFFLEIVRNGKQA